MSHHDLHSSGTRSAAHPGNLVARRTPAPAPGDRRYPQASMSHHDSNQLNRQTPVPGAPAPARRQRGSGSDISQSPTPTPTGSTGRLQFQAPRHRPGGNAAQVPTSAKVQPRHPLAQPADSRPRQTRWPARPVGQAPRWPAPAAWSSRRPSARRPRCHTTTATSSTGRLPSQANPVASPARRPGAAVASPGGLVF